MKLILSAPILAGCALLAGTNPCLDPEAAKAVAECETLGEAVSARLVKGGAGFGRWEVLVHMPGAEQGWRCFIRRDTSILEGKERIPNPPSKVR